MFAFLQPIWLFGLAGLAAPIIIHLWNQRPGKVLKVGSVAWVTTNTQRYKTNIRLSDILLLVLRCLLIAIICIALAGLVWKRSATDSGKGWILLSRDDLPAGYNHFKPTIDSLLKAGFEFHLFEEGFKKVKPEEVLQQPADTNHHHSSYRQLTALLNEQVDAHLPLYIFSNNYLRNFKGDRTGISLNLHWMFYTADTAKIRQVNDRSLTRLTIFTKQYPSDARYVKAALDAVQQYTKRNISITLANEPASIPLRQDWLFWLADGLPASGVDATHILYYANGKQQNLSSVILPADQYLFEAVRLNKTVGENDSLPAQNKTYWQDGFGHALLSAIQNKQQVLYKLNTHFDPAWNDLPWNENFPAILYRLLFPVTENDLPGSEYDKTLIAPKQAIPLLIPAQQAAAKPALAEEVKLSPICWVLAFVLLFSERALSFHHHQTKKNG